MDTGALHTDASANGVDTVVVGFHGDFGFLARFADDLLDGDESVIDFRHFRFEESLQEHLGGTGEGDDR